MGCGNTKLAEGAAAQAVDLKDTPQPTPVKSAEPVVAKPQENKSTPKAPTAVSRSELPENVKLFFILGGPGSGKSTICAKLAGKYACAHISAEELLDGEVKSGTSLGERCEKLMKNGEIVPMEITLSLIRKAIFMSSCKDFLIDGIPMSVHQAESLENEIKECFKVVFLDCPSDVLEARSLSSGTMGDRTEGRDEDLRKRIEIFSSAAMPLVEHYKGIGKCLTVAADADTDAVFQRVEEAIGEHLKETASHATKAETPQEAAAAAEATVGRACEQLAGEAAAPAVGNAAVEAANKNGDAGSKVPESINQEAVAEVPAAYGEEEPLEKPVDTPPVQLLPQPQSPEGKFVVLECAGGSDKGEDGHRKDTIHICNALITKGWEARPVFYTDAVWDQLLEETSQCSGCIYRVVPGKYDGVTQSRLDELLEKLGEKGVVPMPHPEAMKTMMSKDALVKIRELACGLADTVAYYDVKSFKENFPKTISASTRVLKHNRGFEGEGTWVCKVKEGQSGDVTGLTIIEVQSTVGKNKEERTVDDFMAFCEQYLEGSNGHIVDQKCPPTISEGVIRLTMIHNVASGISCRKALDGDSSITTSAPTRRSVTYQVDEPEFAGLMIDFVGTDVPDLMPALGMDGDRLPLLWAADFVLGDKKVDGTDTYIISKLSCCCVDITEHLHLAGPVADAAIALCKSVSSQGSAAQSAESAPALAAEVPAQAGVEGAAYTGSGTPDPAVPNAIDAPPAAEEAHVQLLPQPSSPKGKFVILECAGGRDKCKGGHRVDTITICNALIGKGWESKPMSYADAEWDQVFEYASQCQGVISRVGPGKHDGVTHSKLDDLLERLTEKGVVVMPRQDVVKKMGSKDALLKLSHLSTSLPDTVAYSDAASFRENFPRTIAASARVLKPTRGSHGDGVWVCKLKEERSGDVTGSTLLVVQEAVDNHKEERALGDFMTFCEQYLEGNGCGLVDQRFLPRVTEGELSVSIVHDKPVEIVHKKPVDGGVSATVGAGASCVSYPPDDAQFAPLMHAFVSEDLPRIMPALGMDGEPLPLVWEAEFILGDKQDDGTDAYFLGELNCSCVGVTNQRHVADAMSQAAIDAVSKQ